MPHRVIRRAASAPLSLLGFRAREVQTTQGWVHALEADGPDRERLPLVVIHGFASSAMDYLPLILRLRPEAGRVVAPDLPGHGLSDVPPDGRLDPESLRVGVVEALDELIGDRPAVIFGNSMGGLAAIRYASHHPDRVAGLVLSSPGGARMDDRELAAFLEIFRVDDEERALAFLDRLLAERPWLPRRFLAQHVKRKLSKEALRALIDTVTPVDLLEPEEVASLAVPTLLLWGQQEKIFSSEHLAFFERHLPGHARIERPPTFGHAPHVEHTGELAQRIRRFLRELEVKRLPTPGKGTPQGLPEGAPGFSPELVRP
ncbi:MAG TPA: alpha/beta hydrolase [Polyangiaceae bacterium LLY-WYZ-14_1]|nr:alpha/beta hydrolase [Polyangiaceae bacterium LLY-WYZ-14_1]